MKQRLKPLKLKIEKLKTLLKTARFFSDKNKYKYLSKNQNPILFKLLGQIGFFKFHCSNKKKQIVCYHQIVLFISKGYKYLIVGGSAKKGKTEIHHIDSNTSNNDVSNLVYTSPIINKAISTITSIVFNRQDIQYHGTVQWSFQSFDVFYGDLGFIKLLTKSLNALGKIHDFDALKTMFSLMPYNQSCLYEKLITNLI